MKSNITVELLDDPPNPADITAADLAALDVALSADEAKAKARRAAWEALTFEKYSKPAAKDRGDLFGTGHAYDGDYDVAVVVPKKVEWDQAKLKALIGTLEAMGEPPTDYMTMKLDVSERAYQAWPASLRSLFEPARTTKPGKAKVTIKQREREAA